MRVLITGAAGFIGSHLSDRFLKEGYAVVGVDNLITGSMENLEHLKEHDDFQFIEQDVSQPFEVEGEIDAIFHFASPASPPLYLKYPIETLLVGSAGTHNTLEMAKMKDAAYFMASTSEVYGDPEQHPQPESYNGNVSPIGPRSVYDEAKRFSEAMVMAYHRTFGLDTRIIRIFNTYGPRMNAKDGRVVPNFISQALRSEALTVYGDGQQTRCFCYVDDLVEGIFRLYKSGEHNPVNIGGTREMTMLELAELVNKITDNPAGTVIQEEMRIKDDPQVRQPDTTRAKTILDWEPTVSVEEGMRRTMEYFKGRTRV